MRNKTTSLLLYSGGLDSGLLLAWAHRRDATIHLLEFETPDRPAQERTAADRLARRYPPAARWVVRLPASLSTPSGRAGYQATRNLLFHAVGQAYAEVLGADEVLAGHALDDASSFPDARTSYLRSIERLAAAGRPDHRRVPIRAPLARYTNEQLGRLAARLGFPVHEAWSCWRGGRRPCGRCEKCRRHARVAHWAAADLTRRRPSAATPPSARRRPPG